MKIKMHTRNTIVSSLKEAVRDWSRGVRKARIQLMNTTWPKSRSMSEFKLLDVK